MFSVISVSIMNEILLSTLKKIEIKYCYKLDLYTIYNSTVLETILLTTDILTSKPKRIINTENASRH